MSSKTPQVSVSDKEPASAQPKSSSADSIDEEEGGLLPAVVIGGAILAVVAALIFWPTDDERANGAERVKDPSGASVAAAAAGRADAAAPGGVQPRAADEPTRRAPEPRRNPAVRLHEGGGVAPALPEPEVVPDFEDVDEEIAWYEKKLEHAVQMRDKRKQFVDGLDRSRERAAQSPNPEQALEVFESRKKIVEENYEIAQRKVEEIETKLAELRRG